MVKIIWGQLGGVKGIEKYFRIEPIDPRVEGHHITNGRYAPRLISIVYKPKKCAPLIYQTC